MAGLAAASAILRIKEVFSAWVRLPRTGPVDQAGGQGNCDCRSAAWGVDPSQNVTDVAVDRTFAKLQFRGNFAIGQSACDMPQNLGLPWRQQCRLSRIDLAQYGVRGAPVRFGTEAAKSVARRLDFGPRTVAVTEGNADTAFFQPHACQLIRRTHLPPKHRRAFVVLQCRNDITLCPSQIAPSLCGAGQGCIGRVFAD